MIYAVVQVVLLIIAAVYGLVTMEPFKDEEPYDPVREGIREYFEKNKEITHIRKAVK